MPKRPLSPASLGQGPKRRRRDGERWASLKHRGPMFPDHLATGESHFIYEGQPCKLTPDTEEIAIYYAKYLMRKKRNKKMEKILNKNYFDSWRSQIMTEEEKAKITEFDKCDFSGIVKYLEEEAKRNKMKPKIEKATEKEEREKKAELYRWAIIDNVREAIGKNIVEPPGIYMGRGNNPKTGLVKRRIKPKDVTINCDIDSVPEPVQWKAVVQDNTATWLAKWKDPIWGKDKYIQLDPSSTFKSQSEQKKYSIAKKLEKKIDEIRNEYKTDMRSKDAKTKQHACALFLIDQFALRAGNEKGKGEVGVGCCSLRKKHIDLRNNRKILFDFLGKDSIKFNKEATISQSLYNNLLELCEGKRNKDRIFDQICTHSLNTYLGTLMPGLTAKVFRTFKATECFNENVEKYMEQMNGNLRGNPQQNLRFKKLVFDKANLDVAKLLNHHSLTKKRGNPFKKLEDKIKRMARDGKCDRFDLEYKKAELKLSKDKKDHSLITSKQNYINPVDVLKWCKKNKVESNKIYSNGQIKKFKWAEKMVESKKKAAPLQPLPDNLERME